MKQATSNNRRLSITAQNVSKRFGRNWVIRDFTDAFRSGERVGIRGRNGSGKSTLLRMLCGQLTPSRGKLDFILNDKAVRTADFYRYVSWTGPYLEIVEELSIADFIRFHFGLKPLREGLKPADVPALLELDHVRNRKLSDCSSGMRQRVLLGSALYAATPLLILDEPTVTLDEAAVSWFHAQLTEHGAGRLVFVASNDADDLAGCARVIDL